MKAEVLAPDKGSGKRDFRFEADVKRVHIYPTGFPEYEHNWLSIVEGEDGKIKVIWHGKFVGEVKTVYELTEEMLEEIERQQEEGYKKMMERKRKEREQLTGCPQPKSAINDSLRSQKT